MGKGPLSPVSRGVDCELSAMAPHIPLAMGESTGVDRYTFHVSAEGNHRVLRELAPRTINNDEAQEQVIVVDSLQTLNFGAAGTMTAIPTYEIF